jgi:hypothetical protein
MSFTWCEVQEGGVTMRRPHAAVAKAAVAKAGAAAAANAVGQQLINSRPQMSLLPRSNAPGVLA